MTPRVVVVSGASRGVGEALALRLAGPGTHLHLLGRDPDRLAAVAAACRARGAEADVILADVRDRDGLRARLLAVDDRSPVDLVIANAGIALSTADADLEATTLGEIDVNLVGALNTVFPLIDRMRPRGRGQVALMSSIAAFAPLPDSPAYSGTKAALLVWGLAMRERLARHGVRLSVICPGFIDTGMAERYQGWKPFLISADRAADRIVRGLERNRPVIAFPRRLALLARMSTFVPEPVRRLGLTGFRFEIGRR